MSSFFARFKKKKSTKRKYCLCGDAFKIYIASLGLLLSPSLVQVRIFLLCSALAQEFFLSLSERKEEVGTAEGRVPEHTGF